ncbi:MAG: galactose mutarotase [Oscillospiraceae bacterium]|nr:galactose mutarotase [Oscillospiraceae bacterium]
MSITKKPFGVTRGGEAVFEYTIEDGGAYVSVITYGAAVTKIVVPDRGGELRDVTLGYDKLEEYEASGSVFGALCGRVANRIANGEFTLNGGKYALERNAFPHHLHGGAGGFHRRVWESEVRGGALILSRVSPGGEEGYPGTLETSARFAFADGRLTIATDVRSDADTVANIVNHSYFNLNGHGAGNILRHRLKIGADAYCETDGTALVRGVAPAPVAGTPLDFRGFHEIGERIDADFPQTAQVRGYDHNFALNGSGMRAAAEAAGDVSGITLTVSTDLPGIQLYTANYMRERGKGGAEYNARAGFCLEAQYFPNAVNVPEYESPVLRAGETRTRTVSYAFSA